jgi:hypothetical protein
VYAHGDRLIIAVRYDRRGLTNLWDADHVEFTKVLPDFPWTGPGVWQRSSDNKRIRIEVAVEVTESDDIDEIITDAEKRADECFRTRHPKADLVPGT